MVPVISNMPEEFEMPSRNQGNDLPPGKYEFMFLAARFLKKKPIKMVTPK